MTTKKHILISFILIFSLCILPASASLTISKTPLGAGTPPATERLTLGQNRIDYTAVAYSKTDARIVQFRDLSKGKETFIRWDFGDGCSMQGTKITPALKNPVHKFSKKGYYISCMTIKCEGSKNKMWVHKTLVIK